MFHSSALRNGYGNSLLVLVHHKAKIRRELLLPSDCSTMLLAFGVAQAVLASPFKIKVSDVGSDVVEELDFSSGGRVVEMSLAFGHLVAATHNQVREKREDGPA